MNMPHSRRIPPWGGVSLTNLPGLRRAVIGLAFCLSIVFGWAFAGDAVVHLVIAENMATGHWFQFNGIGDVASATTSPLWTMFLSCVAWVGGVGFAAVAMKCGAVAVFFIEALLILGLCVRELGMTLGEAGLGTCLWLSCPSVLVNSLSGMENALSAVLIVLLFRWLFRNCDSVEIALGSWVRFGVLAGASVLARPESAIAVAIVAISAVCGVYVRGRKGSLRSSVTGLLIATVVSVVIVTPWLLFQKSITGDLAPGSSAARFLQGRRFAFQLIPGFLYWSPKTIGYLAGLYFPVALGVVAWVRTAGRDSCPGATRWARRGLVAYLVVMVVFFSFIYCADHVGRYTLPLMALGIPIGSTGFVTVVERSLRRTKARRLGMLAIGSWCTGILIAYVVLKGVIYGLPAFSVWTGPQHRTAFTDAFLADTGLAGHQRIRVAATEVQLRYFTDDRVDVRSLDGRTSKAILAYMDSRGCPNFDAYLDSVQPDVVELGQWDSCGGDNLLVKWESELNDTRTPREVLWRGRRVIPTARSGFVRVLYDSRPS